jgi:TolA-binding protein
VKETLVEDLSALARRDELAQPEQERFEVSLKDSAEARLFYSLGRRFDAEDPSPPVADAGSEAVVEAVLKDLREKAGSLERRALPRSPWVFAAAAVLAASFAGAVVGVQRLRSRSAPPAIAARPDVSSDGQPIGRSQPSVPIESVPSQLPAEPARSAELSTTPPTAAPSSPAELLSAAGRARRAGQPAQAENLLQALRTRYPNSPEAIASEITLGELQLERGDAGAALARFDGYLRRSPGGALAPEALWGRAKALTQLGRSTDARASLSELLEHYPNSPYASSARAKLGSTSPRP